MGSAFGSFGLYCYAYKQRFQEGIILRQKRKHVWILGNVDEDGEGILRYRRVVLDQQLQIFHRRELGSLKNRWLCFGKWEESLDRWKVVSGIVGTLR